MHATFNRQRSYVEPRTARQCAHMSAAQCTRVAARAWLSSSSNKRANGQQPTVQTICTAAKSARAEAPPAASASWEDAIAEDDHMGPAFRATLAMLEWPRLCDHVAAFASTSSGKAAVKVGCCEISQCRMPLLFLFCLATIAPCATLLV